MTDAPAGRPHLELEVEAGQAGRRLDQFLAARLPEWSRSRLQDLIRRGHVAVVGGGGGGRPPRPGTIVRAGMRVRLELPPPEPSGLEPEPLPITILHEDADIVVVDKPTGMVVHPAAGHRRGTLVNALLHHVRDLSGLGGERRPGIVHRLDRGTSGVLVVAKHDAAHEALARQFRSREIEKEYVALVWGALGAGRRIELPVGRHPVHRQKMSTRAKRGRAAVTSVIHAEPLGAVTLVRLAIATGRTHQIRVHLSAIGHPVVGDPVYGGRRRPPPALGALARLDRPFLHAHRLAFAHPRDGRRVVFEAPLPPDLAAVLEELRGAVRTGGEGGRR